MTTSGGESRRWFYVREGRRTGPVETTRLVDLVLNGEVPEDALVWHSGLPDWLPAREVEEIRRELPPPVPTPPVPPPPAPVPKETAEDADSSLPSAEEEEEEEEETDEPADPSGAPDRDGSVGPLKRRRKRKRRHRDSKRRPTWLGPLVVVLVGLMIFLWWLLRRMNEVPPGRIIQTGVVHAPPPPAPASRPTVPTASRWDASRASAPASRLARRG